MKKTPKILGIIPARGGSKRIPNKNIKKLLGKPMIYYTIKEAKKSKYLSEIVVSTEDKKIAKIVNEYNVKVIDRPKYLAKDTSSSLDIFKHVITQLENKENFSPDIVVILQPTSPLRIVHDIDNSIRKFIFNKCDSVVSVSKVEHPPHWMYILKNRKLNRIIIKGQENKIERKDLPTIYQLNGAVEVTSRNNIIKNNSLLGKMILPYLMPLNRSIDIDNVLEFNLTKLLLSKK